MLQLQTKGIDICQVSKILVKYNIQASITNRVITLEGDISEEMLSKLCSSIDIESVQNYTGTEELNIPKEKSFSESEEITNSKTDDRIKQEEANSKSGPEISEEIETTHETEKPKHKTPEYELIYPVVKRGQAYWCDVEFVSEDDENTYTDQEHPTSKLRPVIIISNDEINMNAKCHDVNIIYCSTKANRYCPWNYHFKFSEKIMTEKVDSKVDERFTNACGNQCHNVKKARLREYIGTMTPEFMEKIQDIIDVAYGLNREVKTIVKEEKVYVYKNVPQKTVVNQQSPKQIEEANAIKKQLLSYVDNNELQQILKSDSSDQIKAQKILELYGFDLEKNGVLYLLKAINISTKQPYFNLETLSEKVSKKVGVAKEEVMRLIVARVKERFSFKKAPTIEFIRLINSLLLKQEEQK